MSWRLQSKPFSRRLASASPTWWIESPWRPASSIALELRAGGQSLEAKARDLRPRIVAVLGLGAYRTAFGRPAAEVGEQKERLAASRLWLLPNPSGLQARYQMPEMTALYRSLHAAAGVPNKNSDG